MALLGLFKKEAAEAVETVAKEAGDTARAFSNQKQGSSRHETDMLSDNKLSKNIRPLVMIWLMVLFTAMLILSWLNIPTPAKYQETIFLAIALAIGFYFPGRDLVKTFAKRVRKDG